MSAKSGAHAVESLTRAWWRRLPLVLTRPREVFEAAREVDDDDLQARQEPLLLVILLAGMGGVLMSPTWGHLFDDPAIDGLLVAVLTFVAGGLYGAVVYFVVGLCVHLGAKGVGGATPARLARHVVGLSLVPLAVGFLVALALELAVFGSDAFGRGGVDEGAAGDVVLGIELVFVAWSVALLVLGVRVVYGLTWVRTAAALAVGGLFLAAFTVITSGA